MARNIYFSESVRSEQKLYENIIIESLKMYGQDLYYLPRTIVNENRILGEDVSSKFSNSYKIEMYIENTDGFDGEGDLFTKFGIELRDQATFVIARRRWRQLVGDRLADNQFRPREGDVIYLPLSESLFEVKKVETESPFYQLSQLPQFRMQCELFEFSDEDFDTNIDTIDRVEEEHAFQYELVMENTGEDNYYYPGEKVYQDFGDYRIEGEVTSFNSQTRLLTIAHTGATDGKFHLWTTDMPVIGMYASFNLVTINEGINEIQPLSQNEVFDDFANDFVDFTETNPFGDIS